MDKAIHEADHIADDAQIAIDDCYRTALETVLKRHSKTMERIKAYEEKGKGYLVRALFYSSGLRTDLTNAIVAAGKQASAIVERQRAVILEVMADDDGA